MSKQSAPALFGQTHAHLQRRWSAERGKLAFSAQSLPVWRAWRRSLRLKLMRLTGFDTMSGSPLRPRITEELKMDGYLRQRVELRTEPGITMPLFVLIPKTGQPPFPAVLTPHGHGSGGKAAVCGCRENPEIAEAIDQYNYDYGVQLARAGFMVFSPDARGFGERREIVSIDNPIASSCLAISNMAIPLGQTVTGMWAWDLCRLIDYVETRRDCLRGAIGCAGLSGGGLQTLWTSALDERIRCTVISGYFFGYKESLLDQHMQCSCNYVPRLYEYADMGDIAALIAPRPLLIETGDQDPLNGASGLKNVRSQVRITRKAYRLLQAGGAFRHAIFQGGHRWDGTAAIPWLRKWLVPAA